MGTIHVNPDAYCWPSYVICITLTADKTFVETYYIYVVQI